MPMTRAPVAGSRAGGLDPRWLGTCVALLLWSAALAQVPPFLGAGHRLSWHAGGSTLEGARMVPDPEGWLERDGQRYRVESTRGGGGIGVQHLDIVVSAGGLIVADARAYLDAAAGGGQFVASGADAVIGDASALGEYWQAPARLAALQPGFDGATRIVRGTRRFGGVDREVVSIATSRPDSYVSHTYDLTSGVLLFGGTVFLQPGARITDPEGRITDDLRGSAGFTHLAFLGFRRLEVPWLGAAPPAWAAPGATLLYEGTRRAELAQPSGLPPLPGDAIRVTYTLQQRLGDAVLAASLVEAANPAGVPMPGTTSLRVFASNGFDGLWIPPDGLARLTPGTLLDRDPYTRQEVVYAGLHGDLHVLVVQDTAEVGTFYYDRGTGFLMYTSHRRQADQVGVMVTELGFAGMR